ncbi:hypothetical protein HMPREF9124_0181 [Oribacterium sp. oral taxon 108 str. F0425]|nr:hypothetical protein HMPREF9124_0181 [Oribacterium sp. oral taxon 108 str. F0425]
MFLLSFSGVPTGYPLFFLYDNAFSRFQQCPLKRPLSVSFGFPPFSPPLLYFFLFCR